VNDALTREQEDTLAAAGAVAELLLTNDKVSEVQLVEVPHWDDGPPYYIGPLYRIIAIVSNADYEQYVAWLKEPFIVEFQDGADDPNSPTGEVVFTDERPSTVKEAAWAVLDETVGENDDSNAYYFFNQIVFDPYNMAKTYGAHNNRMSTTFPECDKVFDIVPLRQNWQEEAERLDAITGSYINHEYHVVEYPLFLADSDRQAPFWALAAGNYKVYDPNQKKFFSAS
jgi:hypothetical protein